MTTYRVGDEGATVFGPDGAPMVRLPAGAVVVPGVVDVAPPEIENRRIPPYDDKRIRPVEDK